MRTQHALSAAFPAMLEPDFLALVEDIRENGQRDPIVIFEDQVLDGFHRYRACTEILGHPCAERGLPPGLDPVAYVLSQNLHRRHLTASQRAGAVAATAEYRKQGPASLKSAPGALLSTLAKSADVSLRTMKQAKKAQEAGLGDAIRDGKISVKRAAEIADLPEAERAEAVEAPAPKQKPIEPPARSQEKDTEALDVELEKIKELNLKLEAERDELSRMLRECQDDCDSMARVFEADDKIKAAMDEAKRFRELARVLDSRNKGMQSEIADLNRFAKKWKVKAEKLEKELEAAKVTG